MKSRILLVPLLLLGACQSWRAGPYSPVESIAYSALGHDPFWLLTIGDDQIILTIGPPGGRADGALDTWAWPRVLPVVADGASVWESAAEDGAIRIEARRAEAPCEAGGRFFEEQVRVAIAGRTLVGCGGRMIEPGAG